MVGLILVAVDAALLIEVAGRDMVEFEESEALVVVSNLGWCVIGGLTTGVVATVNAAAGGMIVAAAGEVRVPTVTSSRSSSLSSDDESLLLRSISSMLPAIFLYTLFVFLRDLAFFSYDNELKSLRTDRFDW